MASSFLSQIPPIIYLISQIKPKSILDIGKGFGKYGFLIHEYIGINKNLSLNPSLSMKEQSDIIIDAVEIDKELLLPHLDQIYRKVYVGNVLEIYKDLTEYDLIIMIDVIEHLDKNNAIKMLEYFISKNIKMIIATPEIFFEQHLYNSKYEEHISHWDINDFRKICNVDYQKIDGGIIYLLTKEKINIRGFGHSIIKKIRRIRRAIINEL